jgi:hypothetical protein
MEYRTENMVQEASTRKLPAPPTEDDEHSFYTYPMMPIKRRSLNATRLKHGSPDSSMLQFQGPSFPSSNFRQITCNAASGRAYVNFLVILAMTGVHVRMKWEGVDWKEGHTV